MLKVRLRTVTLRLNCLSLNQLQSICLVVWIFCITDHLQ
jgi:hypothetical protein